MRRQGLLAIEEQAAGGAIARILRQLTDGAALVPEVQRRALIERRRDRKAAEPAVVLTGT